MQSSHQRKRYWVVLLLVCGLAIKQGAVLGQSFAEVLQAGQVIKTEWIQQELRDTEAPQLRVPRSPDELQAGESELRVGLSLRSAAKGTKLVASIDYVSYLAIPLPEKEAVEAANLPLLTEPVILDTRFRDEYFKPQLFLFAALTEHDLPVSCREEDYQRFFAAFRQQAIQSATTAQLLDEQVAWLQETSLPRALSSASVADFFCQLPEEVVPEGEFPILVQSRKEGSIYRNDYLRVDHPPKVCLIRGQIISPATDQVSLKLFREGNWLEFWRDSLLDIAGDGSFQFAFPLDHARIVSLAHGYQSVRLYLEPGDTVELSTNANAIYRELELGGTGPAENIFLRDFYHEMRGDTLFKRFDYELLQKDHLTFFQKERAKEARELDFLEEHAHSLRPGFVAMMRDQLKLEHANTQWEAAYRFMAGNQVDLTPELIHHLQGMAKLLYRLPRGKTFDFDVEEYLAFQFQLLRKGFMPSSLGSGEETALARLLPGKETFVRHAVMQLFRKYTSLGALTESGKRQLAELMEITRDTQLVREMEVFASEGGTLPEAVGFRTLQKGKKAPLWSFRNAEGAQVQLEDFFGEKLLLHIGWLDNLDVALDDIQYLSEAQDQLPAIVHLVVASNEEQFAQKTVGEAGHFVLVTPSEMEILREAYFIDNRSNHYFLLGEDGRIMANHYDLGTAKKLRGAWGELADRPAPPVWTPEQKLKFWRGVGVIASILLVISALLFWRRRSAAQRDQRKRQLLEVELRGIRSQMNPHFLFNAMSAIQNLIRKDEQEKADLYLGEFAGLMRKTLRNSAEAYIPLADEIETLTQYCSLESLRHPFRYEFRIDEGIDVHNTYIPSMILQPIIENAILHGLAPQTGEREMLVEIVPGESDLHCTVTDNGIGVLAAQQRRRQGGHQSVGMKLVRQRLELMGLKGEQQLTIVDRTTLRPSAQGTLVTLTIPVEK